MLDKQDTINLVKRALRNIKDQVNNYVDRDMYGRLELTLEQCEKEIYKALEL